MKYIICYREKPLDPSEIIRQSRNRSAGGTFSTYEEALKECNRQKAMSRYFYFPVLLNGHEQDGKEKMKLEKIKYLLSETTVEDIKKILEED